MKKGLGELLNFFVPLRLDKSIKLISQGLDPTQPHKSTVYSSFKKGKRGRPKKNNRK